jgi:hypothetical protein
MMKDEALINTWRNWPTEYRYKVILYSMGWVHPGDEKREWNEIDPVIRGRLKEIIERYPGMELAEVIEAEEGALPAATAGPPPKNTLDRWAEDPNPAPSG